LYVFVHIITIYQLVVLAHALIIALDLIGAGRTPRTDASFADQITQLINKANKQLINDRERNHIDAIRLFADRYMIIVFVLS